MSKAYYNEIDPFAAEWLRNLIAAGHIAAGEVDERSIEDVTPDDLRGFTQCHFFAGIGGWSYALRLAGWPDNRPIWTGSCPCQPFSAPGKGTGFADDRHLWPSFRWLIQQCSPEQIAGEQVAGGHADVWFDLVHHDVERMGYSFGLTPFPASSVGTPNERERAYWVADSNLQRKSSTGDTSRSTKSVGGGQIIRLADSAGKRLYRLNPLLQRTQSGRLTKDMPETAGICATGWMGNTNNAGLERFGGPDRTTEWQGETGSATTPSVHHRPLEVNGFWRDADWLFCRDGKWRPVEPGTFPLVNRFSKGMGHGKSSPRALAGRNRVGRLKGYGNAINVYAAAAFIRAYMEHSGYDLI